MIQTNWIVQRLSQQWQNLKISIEQIHTTGDRVTNAPLTRIGGDGVFVTEIEQALHERRIDLAVHSLKDLPTSQPDGLRVIVPGPREDVRDLLIGQQQFLIDNHTLRPVRDAVRGEGGALRVGTCSLRRTAQMLALCPEAQILPVRGNVDTRVRKLEAGEYDGIILASAGVHRLGLQERLAERLTYLPLDVMLPAPGQGALGLECRDEPDLLALLAPLQDRRVQAATTAERAFMRHLGAGCYLPVAAYGEIVDDRLTLRGMVISLDGQRRIAVQQSQPWQLEAALEDAERLGVSLAEQALEQGAAQIIQGLLERREEVGADA
jgi:hydroxymethylbilane synthase